MWENNQGAGGTTTPSKTQATIGVSISVQGEITGDEDILVEGSVEGTINLKKNIVTVAKTGKVRAHIYGVVIHVEGEVTGDLFGSEQVIVHSSGKVLGNVTAPRICVEDGAKIKGSMNTESPAEGTLTKTLEVSRQSRNSDLLGVASTTRQDSAKSKDTSTSTNSVY
ncbi:MAG: polymer-forming cytoskeletal protein [Oligoflexia bacterium]|nr:polymer-forming cytoskeletal protein [Oligoflexia bacterium]